jgi:hypothetical protein
MVMARKCVSAHLRSAWQQKPRVIHRYAKDTILKKLFPPVLLRIRVSVCELKKSQPDSGVRCQRKEEKATMAIWGRLYVP